MIPKPGKTTLREFHTALRTRIKLSAKVQPEKFKILPKPKYSRIPVTSKAENQAEIIAIGASTGGIPALSHILQNLPTTLPGIVVVQHLLPEYTVSFASTLDAGSKLKVKTASSGDLILPGTVLLAPGNQHMTVQRVQSGFCVECNSSAKVNGHRPSVDVLFESVAKISGKGAIGILLSGMGSDGAKGLLEMKKSGAMNLSQDESTSVVYGMPKAAAELNASHEILPIQDIAERITQFCLEG